MELSLRKAQSDLKRSRLMRSDPENKVEITLRGDFFPSRIKIKPAAGLDAEQARIIADAILLALREAVNSVYEETLEHFSDLLPLKGATGEAAGRYEDLDAMAQASGVSAASPKTHQRGAPHATIESGRGGVQPASGRKSSSASKVKQKRVDGGQS